MNDAARKVASSGASAPAPGGLDQFVPARQLIYAANISRKYNMVYIETPKTGCSRIKALLIAAELGTDPSRIDFSDLHNRSKSPLIQPVDPANLAAFIAEQKPLVFCFVRNPYTRFLSAYLDKIQRDGPFRAKVARDLGVDPGQRDAVSFRAFADYVKGQAVASMDPHWRVQFFHTLSDRIRHDFVGRTETFEESLREVCRMAGIPFDRYYVELGGHATGASRRTGEFYDESIAAAVGSIYAADFRNFGYGIGDLY